MKKKKIVLFFFSSSFFQVHLVVSFHTNSQEKLRMHKMQLSSRKTFPTLEHQS